MVVKGRRMLLQKWLFLVTIWVLIVGRGTADSGELPGYGIPSPTACLNGPCQPLLSPPLSSLPGYPSYGTPPPPSPFPGYPFYRGPPPPSPHISGYPSYGAPPPPPPPPPTTPTGSGYPSYGAPPPLPTKPTGSGHPSYGATPPPPKPKQPTTSSSPGQGCFIPPFQSCSNGPPTPYEYLPNQNHSVPPSLPLSWISVMVLSLPLAFLL